LICPLPGTTAGCHEGPHVKRCAGYRHDLLKPRMLSTRVLARLGSDGQTRTHSTTCLILQWWFHVGSRPERVLALRRAGVEPLVFTGEVEAPVFLEVAVADDCAQGEDGFGAVQAPSCTADVEPVADQVAACSFVIRGRERASATAGDGPLCPFFLLSRTGYPGDRPLCRQPTAALTWLRFLVVAAFDLPLADTYARA